MTKKFLTLLFVVLVALAGVPAQNVKQLNSTEIHQILKKNKKIVVLDVRTPVEFAAGHLKGAINIDIRQSDFYSKVDKLDKKASYMVYCRTNHRSTAAVDYMKQLGFTNIYQMMDGFPGWAANNLPFEKND